MKSAHELVSSTLVDVIKSDLDDQGKEKKKIELKREPIDITIAIPSRESGEVRHLLEIVADNLNRAGVTGSKFPVGEGFAGRAYKMNGVRTYKRWEGPKQLFKENFIYITIGESNDHWSIYSVPLQHPKNRDLLIGVLSIGSSSKFSGLIPTDDDAEKKIGKTFIDITAAYVVKRLSDLYGIDLNS